MKTSKAPTKHQLKSEATRTALLAAAEVIFARDGYERAQIDEIAKVSGRTRGAVYSQYKTKEQLFFALQEHRINTGEKEIKTAVAKHPGSAVERLAALKDYYADLRDADTAVLDIELKLYAIRNSVFQEEWCEHYARMYVTDTKLFTEAFALSDEPGRSHIRSRLLSLTALKSALILAMRFMPEEFTKKETKLLLKEIFDGLFPASNLSTMSPNRSRSSTQKRPSARQTKTTR